MTCVSPPRLCVCVRSKKNLLLLGKEKRLVHSLNHEQALDFRIQRLGQVRVILFFCSACPANHRRCHWPTIPPSRQTCHMHVLDALIAYSASSSSFFLGCVPLGQQRQRSQKIGEAKICSPVYCLCYSNSYSNHCASGCRGMQFTWQPTGLLPTLL